MTGSHPRAYGSVFVLAALAVMIGCGTNQAPVPRPERGDDTRRQREARPAVEDERAEAERQKYVAAAAETTDGDPAWGTLRGQFVYGGDPPQRSPLKITADVEVCGKHDLWDESLVVNPDNTGLANVVVSLHLARGSQPPDIHESYADTAETEVVLDNHLCRFEPRVVMLRTSQTLVILNSDDVGHNAKIDTFSNPPINPIIPAGGQQQQRFSAVEARPARVSCSIHPWMRAWMVVRDDPYMAVSDEDGRFEIANLPAGEWTFQVWHEKAGYVQQVTHNDKDTPWRRGRVTIDIQPGENDLGTIKVADTLFE